MPESKMKLYDRLTRAQVARWASEVRYSRGWLQGYSTKNEESTDAMIAAALNRKFLVQVSHINGDWVGAHWLKAMDAANGKAWFNGVIFEPWRGPANHWAQMKDWELFEEWAALEGFPTLLCAVFTTNTHSLTWSRERCKLTEIGVREKASPRQPDGVLSDCVVFAKCWKEDIAAARREQLRAWVDEALPGAWQGDETTIRVAG